MSRKGIVLSLVISALAASEALAVNIVVTTTIRVTSGTYICPGPINPAPGVYIPLVFVADPVSLGDGGQGESQKPMFRVENGATLQNCTIGAPAADGIHIYNGARLKNILFQDVGERAITVKSGSTNTPVVIENSSLFASANRTIELKAR